MDEIIPQEHQIVIEDTTAKEPTGNNTDVIEPQDKIIEEEKPTEAGSSSSFMSSDEEDQEDVATEDKIQSAIEKASEEPLTLEKKDETINMGLNINDTHEGSLLPIINPVIQNNGSSPRGTIYYRKSYKMSKTGGEVNKTPLSKAPDHTDFESSDSGKKTPVYKKLDEQNNTFIVHNRKPELTEFKSTDSVIEIPDYEEVMKEYRNQNQKQEEVGSKRSKLVPLFGMMGIGALFYFVSSNQTT